MTYPAPYNLLCHLSHDQWTSGPALAAGLGISRAAIWKQIKQLESLGIAIDQSPQGYRLEDALSLLNKQEIHAGIQPEWHQQDLQLHLLPIIDSTNTFLKQHTQMNTWTLCLSEQQLAGKGRLGRSWSSPFGENMYLSIAWRTTRSLVKLSGLSIAASLALKSALAPWISSLRVKWPNDLVWGDKKLAGILVEVCAESHGSCLIIVGIGLNINTQTKKHPLSELPHTSMRDILGHAVNKNEVIVATINHCLQTFTQFDHYGLRPLQATWKEADCLYNKKIKVYQPQQTLHGIAKGINPQGHLLVEGENGQLVEISSGEASLRQENPQ